MFTSVRQFALCPETVAMAPMERGFAMPATELSNAFLTNTFDEWIQQKPSKSQTVRFANKVLRKLGINLVLAPPVRTGSMTSVEQRVDMYHLASAALF
ncbi:MAG: hypothetical protein E5Y65_02930 [Mesorhizobium sp.]|uniref:hypothetical protein n=1 Tax=Mesorhizobium sp. TaxID=1871066 RepID=UPI00121EBE41|nr:hypothetical protein [Mesorhizobium sp.]TIL76335.1 MAG: hypothetical protein E5Y70_03580 [Mesorhizobium sp.]TIL93961.1 MAG: hypothetical protein E5Y65_02930 [Mesorhizobium sp.]TIM02425.1 MAG: hypothetical protein E5Y64_08385 [Mesorhizobium sp.]